MRARKDRGMDPLLAAARLPRLAQRAMALAIAGAVSGGGMTPRALVDRALVTFEASVTRLGAVRPTLLFAERDRIARELRVFVDGRLARRLRAQKPDALVAAGRAAAPFDVVVRNRRGATYAVVFRRLPRDGHRLVLLQRIRAVVQTTTRTPVDGVLVYDFSRGTTVRLDQTRSQCVHRYLRAS
jgi:hypothetical protein